MHCTLAKAMPLEQEFDLCIIGSGPAGLALAHQFLSDEIRICLIESGRFTPNKSAQRLNKGENRGIYYDLEESRCRAIGGTLHMWQGTVAPLDPIDFEKREWIPNSGWPIDAETMRPWYQEAASLLGISAHQSWFDGLPEQMMQEIRRFGIPPATFSPKPFISLKMQVEPLCQQLYRPVLSSSRLLCLSEATATELIESEQGGRIEAAAVSSLCGRHRATLRAKRFVVCAGGLETPRLLLNSRCRSARGVGNEYDVVGRYFMDHPRLRSSVIVTPNSNRAGVLRQISLGRYGAKSGFTLAPALQQAQRIANHNLFIGAASFDVERLALKALRWLRPRRSALVQPVMAKAMPDTLTVATTDVEQRSRTAGNGTQSGSRNRAVRILRRVWRATPVRLRVGIEDLISKQRFERMTFITKIEQHPNPESRITLSDETDPLGVPLLRMAWQLTAEDHENIERFHALISEQFAEAGFDTSDLTFKGPDGEYFFQDSSHPMGATRMADDPRSGVVDANLKVFSQSNLYLCSSSVFPTGGNANATLTILALAIRLGQFLRSHP
ncbi:GMC oxidoreductase [Ferrimonas pelagia]|uniref:GMC family oxidoreductase n=1 Tax=Ferrimonas pelagia TaxID=1177826 RepID=A0ABP9F9A8_9GAMM